VALLGQGEARPPNPEAAGVCISGGAEIIAQRRGMRRYGRTNHEPACVREIGRTAPRTRTWWRRNRKVKVGMSLAFGFVFIAKVGIVADWFEAGLGV
jgi:hypothetical protein